MFTRLRHWLPRSFRTQLACCFALLGAVLAIVLSVSLGGLLAHRSRLDASAELYTVAHNAARLLSNGLFDRFREVQVLADSRALWVDGIGSPQVADTLQRSQAVNPHSVWIGVADPDGVVRAATQQLLVGVNVRERPWFVAGLRGPFVGDVHPAKLLAKLLPPGSDGGPLRFVDFAAPIERDGRLLGVLAIHGSWEWTRATIESLLPDVADRDGLEVFVFDRAGQMIYAPGVTLARHQQARQGLPMQRVQNEASRAAQVSVAQWQDGDDYLTAAATLESRTLATDLGWTVVVRQPVDAAYAAARDGAAIALVLGLVAAALSAGFGWWLAGPLTGQMRQIARGAQAAESASLPEELPVLRGSIEIERLSLALNGMTRRLLGANADLEQRVRERTAELLRANAALEQLALHDTLTGLLNRRGLDERVASALAGARRRRLPLSLLVIDADHFKQVNDRFGHDIGDLVLKAIATTLGQRLREVDIVARIGGEEFVVLLPDTGSLGASQVAAALVDAVGRTPMPEVGRVTISCGVAEMGPGDHEGFDAALRRADAAMYRAKQTGRNRHCVDGDASAVDTESALPAMA